MRELQETLVIVVGFICWAGVIIWVMHEAMRPV